MAIPRLNGHEHETDQEAAQHIDGHHRNVGRQSHDVVEKLDQQVPQASTEATPSHHAQDIQKNVQVKNGLRC